jgi:valyl-tRNA synthetase
MKEIFNTPYDSKATEDGVYKAWEEAGYFNPEKCIEKGVTSADAEPFTIVLPPPNVTGTLHMGHAAMLAVEDILVRYARMNGKRTLWVPGTDSAAIATQSKVETELFKKEEKTRYDLGREEFLKRVNALALESQGTILNQLRKMGSSLDWSRLAYTLDDTRYNAVMTAFVRMYDAGLIYRGMRIVNWDPKMQTTVSDDELEHKEIKEPLYYLKYGPFTIATARPETKFGDKYVVMHPDDPRYAQYEHKQQIPDIEWIGGKITATVIKDASIDMEFGTGVMTITPWHDATDFEIAERHGLDRMQVIDYSGKLLSVAGELAGQHIKKARPMIVEILKNKNLIDKIDETYVHNVAVNSRGGGTIEPQIKMQWFIAVDKEFTIPHSNINGIASGSQTTLKKLMRAAVEGGQVDIIPDNFAKIYHHWIDNLRDWCISRQIWFGHRIPVWYHTTCQMPSERVGTESWTAQAQPIVGVSAPTTCPRCGLSFDTEHFEQDPDTLDTWFSSGLWTFSTLGWPNMEGDMKVYHPTSVLETGYDILFFWIARMVLMSGFHLGEVPFKTVYLHGLVRDGKGQKMSKSLGNIINPLDMIEKYGADATRLSLIVGATPGTDIKLSEDKIKGYKHFANKIWNISRFVLMNVEGASLERPATLPARDEEILAGLASIVREVTTDINEYRLYMAAEKAYHYVWSELADKILEESKPILTGADTDAKAARQYVLYTCLTTSLKLLHPFMPFVTETIWQNLPQKDADMLIVAKWPSAN